MLHSRAVQSWSLISDIGGSSTRLARVLDGEIGDVETFSTQNARSIPELVSDYVSRFPVLPNRAVIAVAAPISKGAVQMTNAQSNFDVADIEPLTCDQSARFINDFEAAAWALSTVESDDVDHLSGPTRIPYGNRVILGPGTGLGVGILVQTPYGPMAVPGEGGHIGISPQTDFEVEVFKAFRTVWPDVFFGQRLCVEAEAFLSGRGLPHLHQAVSQTLGMTTPDLTPQDLLANPKVTCPAIVKTREIFRTHLGQICADLALTTMSRGGVFIAGGVAVKNPWLFDETFIGAFRDGGRFSALRSGFPLYLMKSTDFGLVGARNALMSAG
ncbi:glucokinase [Litoreibacter albidus]|uniref:Glucokinase n=1 Tax=Litoreibacter albidus TaxID=670155 RepID=A0A1H3CTN5_9RHOB|nr:ROK family protein [Litoreibacter albidus]SDX57602.1 glucokinase [Litoreibacter albidus]